MNVEPYFKEMWRISQPGGLLVTWTDYWQTPTETGGLHFYGVPIHVFTEEEVLNALHLAKRNGFAMTGPITSPVTKTSYVGATLKITPLLSSLCKNRREEQKGTAADGNICNLGHYPAVVNATEVTVASAFLSNERRSGRIAIVEQHIRLENEHDLQGVLGTFGDAARYDDEPWGEHYTGRNGVCLFYEQLMKALPDLQIETQRQHVTDDAILVEVVIRGTHLGGWRGLPATGRRVEFKLCGVYTFDVDDRLAGERIYYDRGTVLRQLGVFHEPQSVLGRICILATHPSTIVRALARTLLRR